MSVSRPVDSRFEVAALLQRLDGRGSVYFTHVDTPPQRVVGNTLTERADVAHALGCELDSVLSVFEEALRTPGELVGVDAAAGREDVSGPDLLSQLPVCVHHEHDAGRYITAGVVAAADAAGQINLSINRLQVASPHELRMLILPGRLASLVAAAHADGRSVELAVMIGVDPLLLLASQVRHEQIDELRLYAALAGGCVEVTPAPGCGLPIPADVEIVIEGELAPGLTALEGPFGEFPRTYGPPGDGPVLTVTRVSRRADAIYQTVLPAGREHLLVGAVAREVHLRRVLRSAGFGIRAVHLTEGGACRFHAVIQIDASHRPKRVQDLIHAAFEANSTLKRVVIVDQDVDLTDERDVEWALATRFQADRDLVVLSRQMGSALDPSSRAAGSAAKLGLDATAHGPAEVFRRIAIPKAESLDVERYLDRPPRLPRLPG